ncbi:MAG: glycoside hydrolase family 25 protein [Hyphomicrobiales bacterium]|nr:glycoside hydrolase family 25 protein [Hyphomicrobiales bacterium]
MIINPKVVDISHYDRVAANGFQQARAFGILGCIHEASEGASVVDTPYAQRRPLAKDAGLLWGAYHFIRPVDVSAQVELFLRVAQPDDQTLLALDYEVDAVSLDQAREFIEQVERKVGCSVVVYSGSTIKEKLGDRVDPWWGARRLWLAQYSSHPVVQRSWSNYWLWQYTGDGAGPPPHQVPGIEIDGGLDINHWDGSDDELRMQWTGAATAEVELARASPGVADGRIAPHIDPGALSLLLPQLAQLNAMLAGVRPSQTGDAAPPIMSSIDKALGGEAMVGLKTPLALLAAAGLWITQAFGAVGPVTATGTDQASTTAQVLYALIAAFGGLGVTSKLDRGMKALGLIARVLQQLPALTAMLPKSGDGS